MSEIQYFDMEKEEGPLTQTKTEHVDYKHVRDIYPSPDLSVFNISPSEVVGSLGQKKKR